MFNLRKKSESGFAHPFLLLIFGAVIGVVGFAGWQVYHTHKPLATKDAAGNTVTYDQQASRRLTNGNCSSAGSVKITSPMPISQVGYIEPYGLTVDGHVTPIDHQYYIGLNPRALRDTYDVVAPADGKIVDIEHRGSVANTPLHSVDIPSSDEYRLIMMHSCSFLTYVDLVTSLDNNVKSKLPAGWDPLHSGSGVNIPITKGEVIGHIGGQTLDFAVWDLSKPLKGFVDFAKDYQSAEGWKLFTAPTSDYLDSSIKSQVLAKYLRTAAPVDGKIDYDVDGKLVGNWFLQGSGGYHAQNNQAQNYWTGHLSIAPDFLDPSVYIASIGNYDLYPKPAGFRDTRTNVADAEQFVIKSASPVPAAVGINEGLVKYELAQKQYILSDGSSWNSSSFATGMKVKIGDQVMGTILAQLTGTRSLKFEAFPSKTAAQVTAFDGDAKIYER